MLSRLNGAVHQVLTGLESIHLGTAIQWHVVRRTPLPSPMWQRQTPPHREQWEGVAQVERALQAMRHPPLHHGAGREQEGKMKDTSAAKQL